MESKTDSKSSGEPIDTVCMACNDSKCDFTAQKFQRRPVGDYDVQIKMKYSGICHSDLHKAAGHLDKLGKTLYPCVPGHELAGVCVAVGSKVTKIKEGMHIGVGCMVDSCLSCVQCKAGQEQKCKKTNTATYCGKNKHGRAESYPPGRETVGGYTTMHVVHEHFAIVIPQTYPLEHAGPVMCAGITMYDPLKAHGAAGKRVGIIGLGGLGIMGIKIAQALGCAVTAISRGPTKKDIALKSGATTYIDSKVEDEMKAGAKSLDLILNTIPVKHDYMYYEQLLDTDGKLVLLGLFEGMFAAFLTGGGKRVVASGIGGIPNTQEIIDLCDKHKIYPETKIIPASKINWAYQQLATNNSDACRYVIDVENTLNEDVKCDDPAPDLGPPVSISWMKFISESTKFMFGFR